MRNTQVTNICKLCNKPFQVKAYRANTAHYCSRECWSKRNPQESKKCKECGTEFLTYDRNALFCSQPCANKWRSVNLVGPLAPSWKGGNATNSKRAKAKGDLKKWREAVYARDKYTCQKCGNHGGKLHAHHIKPVANYPELITSIDNGLTVCVLCHEAIHGRKLSTPAKFSKHCKKCGNKTSGRSELCRACSIKSYHERVGHRPQETCPVCRQIFTARAGQTYCSVACGRKSRHLPSTNSGILFVA